ncbi:site-2 protease family protein [Microvirga roseola]|uniref:site-2 protease family protein n=1 Tax=Microvirga roseola TaxID=2883126 RepID=UPI001E505AAA|nr:site-2 protease family protein [Microvirga roseola]
MVWSIPIARIAGTVVRVHVTFLLFLVWIAGAYWRIGGQDAAIEGVVFIVLLFACVVAHEFGHIFAARRYGIKTPDVTLWPIGGVANLERIPEKPREELIVAVAGPAVNVVIAALLVLVLGMDLDTAAMTELENPRAGMMARLAAANIFLVLFNLIPAFPMDGGRVLRAVLAMRMNHVAATHIAARIGQGAAFLFALAGLFINPMLIVIGLFVYLAASAESQQVAFKDVTRGLPVRAAMMNSIEALTTSATLDEAVDLMLRASQKEFPVVDGAGHPRGLLTRDGLIVALRQGGPSTSVLEVMKQDLPTVRDGQSLESALHVLNRAKAPALLVLNEAQQLVGILTSENIGEMMMVRSAQPDWRFGRKRSYA